MKQRLLIFAAFVFALSFICGCKKKDDTVSAGSAKTYTVTYMLTSDKPAYVTSIMYNNADSVMTEGFDPDNAAAEWKKTITISSKPFKANFDVSFNNVGNTTFTNTMVIMVNDSVKAYKPVAVAPLAVAKGNLYYDIR